MEWTIKLEARTGWGEVHTHEIAVVTRRPVGLTADEVGMSLGEAKGLLAEIQRCIVSSQIDEQVMCARVCADCMGLREIRDHRTRTIQTLFGTVVVDAPRLKLCVCVDTKGFKDISISPLSELLPDRCTPELRRTQSELGARHSFREAARLLATFLPCSPQNQSSVRNRLHRTSEDLEVADCRSKAKPVSASGAGEIVVFIDGAHIRAVPGHQSRHLDVTVGKVEARGRPPRRFGLAPKGAERPLSNVRAALVEQGWQPGRPVTVISDGEPALPNLVQTAINEPVIHILDWFHISMRIRHIEQSMAGLYAMKPANTAPLDYFAWSIDRLRHVLWNGYHEEAWQSLWDLQNVAGGIPQLNGVRFERPVQGFLRLCAELRGYIRNNEDAIVCYHQRYHDKRPVSTSRAEGCVDEIANARMAKKQRMRWSPRGAHHVAQVRAATLDGRLMPLGVQLAA
jgi:hypothetical protein